jgi:hypothetical protein
MKRVVAVLLGLNILYFAGVLVSGGKQVPPSTAIPLSAAPSSIPKLVLLKELKTPPPARPADPALESLEPAAEPASAEVPDSTDADATAAAQAALGLTAPSLVGGTPRCFSLGPVPNAQAAVRLRYKWFKDSATSLLDKMEETEAIKGYWVYLAPAASEQEARETQKKLAGSGLSSGQRMASGEFVNAISLGNYRSQESADKRRSDFVAKGFPAQVLARHATEHRFWLVVQSAGDRPLPEGLKSELPAGAVPKTVGCERFALERQ